MTRKKRTFNTQLIKGTMTYSTQDITSLFHIHKRTVQEWYQAGLPRIDNRKPYLVLGNDLREFLDNRQKKRKVQCRAHEFYCFKCKEPRASWENQVDIKFQTETRIMVVGVCSVCNTTINKASTARKIPELEKIFMIQKTHHRDLNGSYLPICKTDKKGG